MNSYNSFVLGAENIKQCHFMDTLWIVLLNDYFGIGVTLGNTYLYRNWLITNILFAFIFFSIYVLI